MPQERTAIAISLYIFSMGYRKRRADSSGSDSLRMRAKIPLASVWSFEAIFFFLSLSAQTTEWRMRIASQQAQIAYRRLHIPADLIGHEARAMEADSKACRPKQNPVIRGYIHPERAKRALLELLLVEKL